MENLRGDSFALWGARMHVHVCVHAHVWVYIHVRVYSFSKHSPSACCVPGPDLSH